MGGRPQAGERLGGERGASQQGADSWNGSLPGSLCRGVGGSARAAPLLTPRAPSPAAPSLATQAACARCVPGPRGRRTARVGGWAVGARYRGPPRCAPAAGAARDTLPGQLASWTCAESREVRRRQGVAEANVGPRPHTSALAPLTPPPPPGPPVRRRPAWPQRRREHAGQHSGVGHHRRGQRGGPAATAGRLPQPVHAAAEAVGGACASGGALMTVRSAVAERLCDPAGGGGLPRH